MSILLKKKNIFHHLKLEIALASPASKIFQLQMARNGNNATAQEYNRILETVTTLSQLT